ncbi:acetyl-CoA acetyltransferase [Paracoccus sp. SCSIO 75233]|uniref:acetyl-CoA acetyltransferase n=1 Tax=Paracoccus sp. SCSIO 75233 TaxID=3017782 RepID=UPI0022EFD897|nr:acetyl-CoA acetyltransferase [Paracoccus sp. SCSIO 75233]WBU51893.1 acetyl-CoA acetyltransferase [Paracoccus sp. SCSIO 75233]
MGEAYITGWGHTKFGRFDGDLEDLILAAADEAIKHSGITPDAIDAVWIGHFNAGMVNDAFPSSLVFNLDPSMRFIPATRCENACASGSAAIFAARDAIRAGTIKRALVVGVEKMTATDTAGVTEALGGAAYQREEAGTSFPQVFARFAQAYSQAHGDCSTTLAHIAAKNHANAMNNPLAQLHKPLSVEFCDTVSEKNPLIASPLRMTDCSLISDGAAALVISDESLLNEHSLAVGFRAAVQVNDFMPMSRRNLLEFGGPAEAFRRAYELAGVTVSDLSCAEVHDCFTIAELMIYEAMGLAPDGRGRQALDDGTVMPEGRLPVNLSGGLKAKGHPVGATGVSMHVLAARQVTGNADQMQVPGAELACVFNMGGAAVANYVSLLEAVK